MPKSIHTILKYQIRSSVELKCYLTNLRAFFAHLPFLIYIFYNSMIYSDIKDWNIAISFGFQNYYCINFYQFFSVSMTFGVGRYKYNSFLDFDFLLFQFHSKKIIETMMMIIYYFSRWFDHNSPTFIRHVEHFTFYIRM